VFLSAESATGKSLFLYKCSNPKAIFYILAGDESGGPYDGSDVGDIKNRNAAFYTIISVDGVTTPIQVTGNDPPTDGGVFSGRPADILTDDLVLIQTYPNTPKGINLRVWSVGLDKADLVQSSTCSRSKP
jgi:hypothetical protein